MRANVGSAGAENPTIEIAGSNATSPRDGG